MFRQKSILLPSRRDSVRRPPQMDVLPCEAICTRHLHILPPISSLEQPSTRLSVDLENWLKQIELSSPITHLSTDPKTPPVSGLYEIPSGVRIDDGTVLLRVGKSQMGWDERNYQLLVKLADDSVLSCPSGKSGCVQDYFLL